MSTGTPAVFLDKDGTLIDDVPYNVDPARIRLASGAESLRLLQDAGYALVVVSNQSGVAHGKFTMADLSVVAGQLWKLLEGVGVRLTATYWCPHHPQGHVLKYSRVCGCRKPAPGLLQRAARELQLDLERSWMIGDILDDIEAGHRAGCRSILIDNGNETEWLEGPHRRPDARVPDLGIATAVLLSASHSLERMMT